MANVFMSPGIYNTVQDFTQFASSVGITRLGLVGKTQKGPAFEAVKVASSDEFLLRFGTTDPMLPLTYVANSFLSQANDLTISRVLGKSGFTNSPAWIIKSDDKTYTGSTTPSSPSVFSAVTFSKIGDLTGNTTYTINLSASSLMANGTASASTAVGYAISITYASGTTTSADLVSNLKIDTNWLAYGVSVFGGDLTVLSGGSSSSSISFTTSPYVAKYSGATLCVLRSKKDGSNNTIFSNASDVTISNVGVTSCLSDFVISATTGPLTAYTNSGFTVSLDETRDNYIAKVFGRNPEQTENGINLYVETIYPHFIREASARKDITTLNSSIVFKSITSTEYSNYTDDYTHSITPWIVSRVMGGTVHNLFRVHTISDGDSSAKEIKISIANIDVNNHTFDLIVRRFEDTDATAYQTALETFDNLSMDENATNFIGKVIGTYNDDFPTNSLFIEVEVAQSYPNNSVPAGFRGYNLRGASYLGVNVPDVYYKSTYISTDSIFKTYLGISELGYSSLTSNLIGSKNSVKSVESDLFVYYGSISSGTTITKGFHMENIADQNAFVSGNKSSLTAYTKVGYNITDKTQLKFTLVPAGGFDGFDKYVTYLNTYEEFSQAETNNNEQFKSAIDILQNPEEVDINLFATPGIDFSNNTDIVQYALSMIEERADSLYIIDAPRITETDSYGIQQKGTPEEVVSQLESTGIDSAYATTYWPWIQIEDSNNGKYTYQAPTLLAVNAIALTDKVASPWYAPAGLNRALAGTSVKRADVKVSKPQRDTLYSGRINPVASFVQQGIVLWGQKTLQVKQSALDRINIIRLLLQIERLIAAASISLVFEQNDQTLRDQFLSKVEPILLNIQNTRGLNAFKVVMDNSNNSNSSVDRNQLNGKIMLQPTPDMEFLSLNYMVLPTGANFSSF